MIRNLLFKIKIHVAKTLATHSYFSQFKHYEYRENQSISDLMRVSED